MNTNMNRIYAPILFALALFVAIFFMKPAYTDYMDARTALTLAEQTHTEREKTLAALTDLQASFSSSGNTELSQKVKKLDKKWNEAQILSAVMLTDFTKKTEFTSAPIEITSITLDKGKKLPNGLSLGTVNLSLTGQSVDAVIDFLTSLTTNSAYVFTLDTINLPISAPVQKETNGVSLSVDLGVYYYE